jgi:hypothetical protein
MAVLLPLPTVEGLKRQTLEVHSFQAANVDIDLVRVRARNVIGVDTADRTKVVLGRPGIELIEGHCIGRSEQTELFRLDDEMEKPLLRANRTVASNDSFQVGSNLESHPAAMASSLIGWHRHLGSFQRSAISNQPNKI